MDVKKFYGKRFHNLSAATDYIESSDRSHFDFAIIPPNTHWDTDEEDIEEDNILRDDIPRDVPGEVDLFLSSDSDSDDDIPLASLQKRQKLSKDLNPKWRKRITSAEIPETHFYEQSQLEACSLLVTKNPVEIFETIFDDEVVKLIIDQTKIYALQHNKHDFCFNEEDLKIFIGILLYSGYHSMPRERMYWQLDEDTRTPFIANNMSRNRFQEIKQFLHLTDNSNLDFSDEMAKIRPLSQILCKQFCQFGYMHR